MKRSTSAKDVSYVMELLRSRYGAVASSLSLDQLRRSNPQLDRFDWSLLVLVIEVDLKIRIPRRLSDARRMTVAHFAAEIAALPKVVEVNHTLDLLTLLAQALLGADDANLSTEDRTEKPRRKHRN